MRSIFVIVLILAAALGAAGCGSSRTLGGGLSDIGADATLKGVLLADRRHDYSDVDLTVHDGRLMLTGTMRTEEGRARLIENAWKAKGVAEIIDEIVIADKTPVGQGFEDSRLDQAVRARLITDRGVTNRNYKIAVSRGVVYLIGTARDESERAAAIGLAQETAGAARVVSHVRLHDRPSGP